MIFKGNFKPHIENIKYFFDKSKEKEWTGKKMVLDKKMANKVLIEKKIQEKRDKLYKQMNRMNSPTKSNASSIKLKNKNKDLLQMINKKMKEDPKQKEFVESKITGSDFFEEFNRKRKP